MSVNADNFIFHSDFWYPSGYISGSYKGSRESLPATVVLSKNYKDGDYYSAFIEDDSGLIGERFLGYGIALHTYNNELRAYISGQSTGQRFTDTIHWRIYPKRGSFNFLSTGKLEQTAATITGSIPATNLESLRIDCPDHIQGKHFLRGTFHCDGDPIQVIGSQLGKSAFIPHYDPRDNKIGGFMLTPYSASDNKRMHYTMQLVPIEQNSPYAFSSDKYSFAIPSIAEEILQPNISVPPNQDTTVYGNWVKLPGKKVSADIVVKWGNEPHVSHVHYREVQLSPAVRGIMSLDSDGDRVRPKLEIRGHDTWYHLSGQKFIYRIYIYQNNNT